MAARSQDPKELCDEPLLVGFSDTDIAGGLHADDRVERAVGKRQCPGITPKNRDPIGKTTGRDQLTALPHLLTADVHTGHVASVSAGEAQRWSADPAAHVEHARLWPHARQPGDEISVDVNCLTEALIATREIAKVKAVPVKPSAVVGDQIEVRPDAPRGSPPCDRDRRLHHDRCPKFTQTAPQACLLPRGNQHSCGQRSPPSQSTRQLPEGRAPYPLRPSPEA